MSSCLYPDTQLIIFAKAPVAGFCKTRLIPELGAEGAADLQAELIKRCVSELTSRLLCDTELWCTPDTSHECFKALANQFPITLHQQQGRCLGERMFHAMSNTNLPYKIIVGTDIPLLSSQYIEQAIRYLQEDNDVVIGPAEDGGYVLLGLKDVPLSLFRGIEWGSDKVCMQTCQKMTALGLVWQALEPLWDLDDKDDLRRYKAS